MRSVSGTDSARHARQTGTQSSPRSSALLSASSGDPQSHPSLSRPGGTKCGRFGRLLGHRRGAEWPVCCWGWTSSSPWSPAWRSSSCLCLRREVKTLLVEVKTHKRRFLLSLSYRKQSNVIGSKFRWSVFSAKTTIGPCMCLCVCLSVNKISRER
jgi:hypothetical protein